MKDKTSEKAQEGLKDELRRAYDVLRHLKKKVGSHAQAGRIYVGS